MAEALNWLAFLIQLLMQVLIVGRRFSLDKWHGRLTTPANNPQLRR
jgi:hypothetical protein